MNDKYHRADKDGNTERICTKCKTWYPETIEYYYMKNKQKPEIGYMAECKTCAKLRNHKIQELSREKVRKNNRNYFYKNKDKRLQQMKARYIEKIDDWKEYYRKYQQSEAGKASAKRGCEKHQEKAHIITDKEWHSCKMFFNMRCAYCGKPIEEHWVTHKGIVVLGDFHKDHVIDQGKNDLRNCIPSCERCNCSKHDKTLNQWYNIDNINYTYERYLRIYQWLRYECRKYIEKKPIGKTR